jgi:hypothetical protein
VVFGREPAVWIGLIVTIILGAVSTLAGEGVITDVLAGGITDGVNALAQLAVLIAPLIAGILIRSQVTPSAAPSLPQGTTVEVITPAGQPNTSKIL